MKRFVLILSVLCLLSLPVLAQQAEVQAPVRKNVVNIRPPALWPVLFQSNPPLKITETAGSPIVSQTNASQLIFSCTGCVTKVGSKVTVAFPAAGTPGGSSTQVQYNNAGAFGGISGETSDGTNTTFGSGNLRATAPRFTTSILDANGNIHLALTATASAVNYLTYANAAAGGNPTFTATGSSTDIGANWTMKGAGVFTLTPGGSNSSTLTILHSDLTKAVQLGITSGTASRGAVYLGNITPSSSNYTVSGDSVNTNLNATSAVFIAINNTSVPMKFVAGGSLIGPSALGTSATNTLGIGNGTAPTTSPIDMSQIYNGDSAAADSNTFIRNEAGEINRISGLAARNSAQFDSTSSTTLANVTGLTRNVEASRTYAFRGSFQTTANVAGGLKMSVSGTATATAISYEGILTSAATVISQTRATALDTTVCASTTSTAGTCFISGVIQVANAGTLTIQFAQNASNGAASSVLANQFFQLIPVN